MKVAVLQVVALGFAIQAWAAGKTYYVSPDGNDGNAGTGWDCPFATFEKGVEKAGSDDAVIVAPGTYTVSRDVWLNNAGGSGNRTVIKSSTENPVDVTIDGQGKYICLATWYAGGNKIIGLTFQNGHGSDKAGGLYYVPPAGSDPVTVSNCVFRNCENIAANTLQGLGGGVYLGGTGEIVDCLIDGCTVATTGGSAGVRAGGGLALRDGAKARNCIIRNNTSSVAASSADYYHGMGGGVYIESSGSLEQCVITNNTAASGSSTCRSGIGGGVHVKYPSAVTIKDCLIADNKSNSFGGGISVAGTLDPFVNPVYITGCTIIGNHVTGQNSNAGGAGVYAWGNVPLRIANCRIEGNEVDQVASKGGGLMLSVTDFTMTDCIVKNNSIAAGNGGAMAFGYGGFGCWPCGIVSNCVFQGNTALNSPAFDLNYPDGILFADCLISGNTTTHEGCLAYIYNREANRGGVTFRNCFVTKNYAPGEEGDGSGAKMKGFYVNTWSDPLCPVSFEYCTMVDNHCGTLFSPLYGQDGSQMTVKGCSLYDNWQTTYSEDEGFVDVTKGIGSQNGQEFGPRFDKTRVSYSAFDVSFMNSFDQNTFKNTERHNVCGQVEDAKFADSANGDWRLQSGSPLVNAGGAAESWMGEGKKKGPKDLGNGTYSAEQVGLYGVKVSYCEARPRLFEGVPDIGCFEYYCPPGLAITIR